MTKQEIIKEILSLTIPERMDIIEAILEAIDQPTPESNRYGWRKWIGEQKKWSKAKLK